MRGSATVLFHQLMIPCFFFLVTLARQYDKPAASSCIPKERDALLDFKCGLNDPNHLLASWQLTHDCCSWIGVSCSNRTGNVLKLDLYEVITMDEEDEPLAGKISHSLLNLEHLQYLALSGINKKGSNSSSLEFLGSMKNLTHLHLSGSVFSGSIPTQLANLSKLEYLDLSFTSFRGRVPPELGNLSNLQHLALGTTKDVYSVDICWLTRLQSLEYLDMSFMNLSKVIDWLHVLNTIPSLKFLYLDNCELPSTNQLLGHLNLTAMVELDLSYNHYGLPLASYWFWNVTTIEILELSEVYPYGPFPTALGKLTSLRSLDFTGNANAVTMPIDLKDLCDLEKLYLSGSLSHGNIADFVEKLPHENCSSLNVLQLSNNHITGNIPSCIANISTNFRYLDLSGNNITGEIPQEIGDSTLMWLVLHSNQLGGQIPILPIYLHTFDISSNLISGSLPSHFASPNLGALILSSNNINGEIPQSICELKDLVILDLSDNFLEGAFPKCFQMQSLVFLQLSNNSISDMLPSFIQGNSQLSFVDISWNKLYGALPVWIGEMMKMQFLLQSHNLFFGNIPVKITNLRQLRHLNLAGNKISGTIPRSLSNLKAMTKEPMKKEEWGVLDQEASYYAFGKILPVLMKRQELKYGASFFDLVSIDFSQNYFTGGIPDEITSLNGLLNLNLSWNHLTGQIPEKIGDMKSLESLDLSWNYLSGKIPQSSTDLTFLSYVDLSYNNLMGPIPPGGQLDTVCRKPIHV